MLSHVRLVTLTVTADVADQPATYNWPLFKVSSLLTAVDSKRAGAPFNIVSLHIWFVEHDTRTLQKASMEVFPNNKDRAIIWQVRMVQYLRIVGGIGNNLDT